MKVLLLLAYVFVATHAMDKEFAAKFVQEVQELGIKCAGEEKPDPDDIARMMAHKLPETHEGKCVIYCIYKHYNTVNGDGTINVDAGIKALQPLKENDEALYNLIVADFKKCAGSISINSDPCETSFNLVNCCLVEAKAKGLPKELFDFDI
nr:odorant binding protein [Semanotus bifasciatus]